MGLTWTEPGEIAWALIDAHPDTDPLDLNFVDLHGMIVALPGLRRRPRRGQRDQARGRRGGVA